MDDMTLLLIAIGLGGAVLGFGVGWATFGGGKGARAKAGELQSALDSAQEEMAEYKQEVYNQFSDTADKFRALDKSYRDLHQQLASSSVALVGDVGGQLLGHDGADTQALSAAEDELELASQADVEATVESAGEEVADVTEQAATTASTEDAAATTSETTAAADTAAKSDTGEADVDPAEIDTIEVSVDPNTADEAVPPVLDEPVSEAQPARR
ncbi:MAG: DUF1043 family protein [Pseudomonadota bacterium]